MGQGQYLAYSSKSSIFEECLISFSKPQLNFQQNHQDVSSILLPIKTSINCGCSSHQNIGCCEWAATSELAHHLGVVPFRDDFVAIKMVTWWGWFPHGIGQKFFSLSKIVHVWKLGNYLDYFFWLRSYFLNITELSPFSTSALDRWVIHSFIWLGVSLFVAPNRSPLNSPRHDSVLCYPVKMRVFFLQK